MSTTEAIIMTVFLIFIVVGAPIIFYFVSKEEENRK
jgi:hypothetical protein